MDLVYLYLAAKHLQSVGGHSVLIDGNVTTYVRITGILPWMEEFNLTRKQVLKDTVTLHFILSGSFNCTQLGRILLMPHSTHSQCQYFKRPSTAMKISEVTRHDTLTNQRTCEVDLPCAGRTQCPFTLFIAIEIPSDFYVCEIIYYK